MTPGIYPDPLSAARGICFGCIISLIMWAALIIWALWRWL
jgi:hypothetical protein